MAFLIQSRVPFAIRVRPDLVMALADGSRWSIETLLRTKRARHTIHALDLVLPDSGLPVRLAAKRIKSGEWLAVLTGSPEPRRALQTYRRRWAVECLFGDTKTRGLNMEDTHLTDPAKIETLTAILALAMTWVYEAATVTMGMKAIARKVHGRRQKSWFRTSFDALRNALLNAPHTAATFWTTSCLKRIGT